MSTADHEAALKVLHDAEAALKALETVETVDVAEVQMPSPVALIEVPKAPPVQPEVRAKYLDLGPEYLGPVAINGT